MTALDRLLADPNWAQDIAERSPLKESQLAPGVHAGQVWSKPDGSWLRVVRVSYSNGEIGVRFGGVRPQTMKSYDLVHNWIIGL